MSRADVNLNATSDHFPFPFLIGFLAMAQSRMTFQLPVNNFSFNSCSYPRVSFRFPGGDFITIHKASVVCLHFSNDKICLNWFNFPILFCGKVIRFRLNSRFVSLWWNTLWDEWQMNLEFFSKKKRQHKFKLKSRSKSCSIVLVRTRRFFVLATNYDSSFRSRC